MIFGISVEFLSLIEMYMMHVVLKYVACFSMKLSVYCVDKHLRVWIVLYVVDIVF